MTWLCVDYDPELWFPVGEPGTPGYELASADARSICARCPARVDCLALARRLGADYGIWGGLDPAQRRGHRHIDTKSSAG